MQLALFWCCDFSELVTTIPVGIWVIRTAESVVLTCCPPAPEDRNVSTLISEGLISISKFSSITGYTQTEQKDVCLLADLSNGEI